MSSFVSSDGTHFGQLSVEKNLVHLHGISEGEIFHVNIGNVSQCVVPQSNRDEVELHFLDDETMGKDDDALVQATFHFPVGDPDDDQDAPTKAEDFKKLVFESGVMKLVTGDVIVEFTKEQGNFVTPRGKYSIQMLSSALVMQGAQYSYRIKYEDIQSLFLLPKPDGTRMAFVISLDKPIRQGNQKYQHLVIETHKIETTIPFTLPEEELKEKFGEQFSKEMTGPLSSMIAKIFKVLSQTTVFVPKHFISSRETNCIRCSLKANDGLLYPLTKSFIFIHKPTVIIKFEDIESIDFQRYDPTVSSGTRNFDLVVSLKHDASSYDAREYSFASIDRAEYPILLEFVEARGLTVIKRDVKSKTVDLGELDENDDEEESEDDDYVGGESGDDDGDDDGDSGDDDEEASKDENAKKKSKK